MTVNRGRRAVALLYGMLALAVPVLQVMLEPVTEICRQPNVVQLPASVESIHTLPSANVRADDLLVSFQCLARNSFQVLANQLRVFSHATTLD